MIEVPGFAFVREGARRTWLEASIATAWHGRLPDERGPGAQLVPSSGRGCLARVPVAGGHALVRTFRHGGVARFLPPVFLSAGRGVAELRALARLAPLGLAPRALGMEVEGRVLKRLRVAVEEIAGARDLLRLAIERPLDLGDAGLARQVGEAVRSMHDAGIGHADLNVANILVDGGSARRRILLVDFDGAATFAGPVPKSRRKRDVLRLCRSLDKWAATSGAPAVVRAAFLRAAMPRGERRELLRLARRSHRWRRLLGRTGR